MSEAIRRLERARDEAISAAKGVRKRAFQTEIEISTLQDALSKAQQKLALELAYAAECEASAATIQEAIDITAAREKRLRLYGGQDPITTTSE